MDGDAVVVEVGLNEAATRDVSPHVPITPQECTADALACQEAGAALVHWHARDPATGDQRLADAALYGAALDGMRGTGLLAYPSYSVDATVPLEHRLDHVWELRARHGLEIAPIDVGSVTVAVWDDAARDFVGVDRLGAVSVVANPLPFVLDAAARAVALRMVPSLGAFDVGATRAMTMLAEARRVPQPVLHKIFLSGTWAVGPRPDERALDLHLAQIPDGLDVEWILVPYSIPDPALVERLCRAALERGGGIRVGVGDNPIAAFGEPNARLVERAVRWAADAGRPVASSADVRRRLGIVETPTAPAGAS